MLALLPYQSDGFVAASYTAVSGAAAICIWFALPAHCQCLCRVSFICFRVHRLPFLTPTTCLRLFRLDLLRNGDSLTHVTSYLLLECLLVRF